ncbi:MAG TPA: nucleoside-diphosphate sugar epimerase/dehydratase, partial [Geobacteraceae bacterium]
RDGMVTGLLVAMCVKPLVFATSGMYRSIWQYASLRDGMEIFKAVSIASVMTAFGLILLREFEHFSRSIFLLDWLFLICLIACSRLAWRVYRENIVLPRPKNPVGLARRTLIVGAGQAGSLLLRDLSLHRNPDFEIVGLVDDDPMKHGMRLHGVKILGGCSRLPELVAEHQVEKVIIAIPSAPSKVVSTIIRSCEKMKVKFKTLPGLDDILHGRVTVSQIRDVEIEDLLGRESAVLEEAAIKSYLTDKRVLITGAAGSIGSELCRQVAQFKPYKVIVLDSAETPLFHLEMELVNSHPGLRIIPVVSDVRNEKRLSAIFQEYSPQVVIHAAAYKHVPLMEYNPLEAIENNVQGSRVLADLADRFEVENFVMISTDKAVNPTNVMGATKRAAELYVQSLSRKSHTKYTTVRFGNVLGSNGSVIPLFKEQIRKGGPIVVTHPEITRYFMTIPEASQLVLQAACVGESGEISLLDMGEPVKIRELAEQLIRLSGLVPYKDVDIVFSGLRPGEKLYEELLLSGEGIQPTRHEKIKVLRGDAPDHQRLVEQFTRLLEYVNRYDVKGAIRELSLIVPEFKQSSHLADNAPILLQRIRKDLFDAGKVRHLEIKRVS